MGQEEVVGLLSFLRMGAEREGRRLQVLLCITGHEMWILEKRRLAWTWDSNRSALYIPLE